MDSFARPGCGNMQRHAGPVESCQAPAYTIIRIGAPRLMADSTRLTQGAASVQWSRRADFKQKRDGGCPVLAERRTPSRVERDRGAEFSFAKISGRVLLNRLTAMPQCPLRGTSRSSQCVHLLQRAGTANSEGHHRRRQTFRPRGARSDFHKHSMHDISGAKDVGE